MYRGNSPTIEATSIGEGVLRSSSLRLLILNARSTCNLSCSYCYRGSTGSVGEMSLDTVTAALNLADQCARGPVRLLIHGAEPLLNGIEWLTEVAQLAQQHPIVGSISIQTNGTLVGTREAEWASRFKVAVGISCDGPADINRATRGCPPPVEAFEHLHLYNVQPAVLCVVSSRNVGRIGESLDFFDALGAKAVRFNQVYAPAGSSLAISDDSFARAMSDAWEWAYSAERGLIIRNVAEIEGRVAGVDRPQGICESVPCGAGTRTLAVDHEGNVFPCNRLVGAGIQWSLGNVRDTAALDSSQFVACLAEYSEAGTPRSCFAMERGCGLSLGTAQEHAEPVMPVPLNMLRYASPTPAAWSDGPGYDDYSDYNDSLSW